MNTAYIKAISYYLPDNILNNEELNSLFPEWSVDKISAKTGIYERRISSENEFVSDMACKASEILFEEHQIDRNQIDFVLLCTQSPDYFLPTTACIVQNKLGLPTSVGALDFNLGCSGYIYGLSLAKGLIAANISKNVLLITSETYSKFLNHKDKSNRTIFGDAASATLVSSDDGYCSIEEIVLGTDGSGYENLIVKNGGLKNKELSGFDVLQDGIYLSNDNNLYMNGGEIFNFTSKSVPNLIDEILRKSNNQINAIDLFVFHQANQFMLNFLRKKIGIAEDKFYLFLKKCGNTVSSTIPIALSEAIKSRTIKKNNKVITAGFGVGYSWGATLLKF
jgi:3-oxoacyl-[acyl-carrier-protein] synthase-3